MKTYITNDFGVCLNPDIKKVVDGDFELTIFTAMIRNKWVCGFRAGNKECGYSEPCSKDFAKFSTKREAIRETLLHAMKGCEIMIGKKMGEMIQREIDDSKQLYLFQDL